MSHSIEEKQNKLCYGQADIHLMFPVGPPQHRMIVGMIGFNKYLSVIFREKD